MPPQTYQLTDTQLATLNAAYKQLFIFGINTEANVGDIKPKVGDIKSDVDGIKIDATANNNVVGPVVPPVIDANPTQNRLSDEQYKILNAAYIKYFFGTDTISDDTDTDDENTSILSTNMDGDDYSNASLNSRFDSNASLNSRFDSNASLNSRVDSNESMQSIDDSDSEKSINTSLSDSTKELPCIGKSNTTKIKWTSWNTIGTDQNLNQSQTITQHPDETRFIYDNYEYYDISKRTDGTCSFKKRRYSLPKNTRDPSVYDIVLNPPSNIFTQTYTAGPQDILNKNLGTVLKNLEEGRNFHFDGVPNKYNYSDIKKHGNGNYTFNENINGTTSNIVYTPEGDFIRTNTFTDKKLYELLTKYVKTLDTIK